VIAFFWAALMAPSLLASPEDDLEPLRRQAARLEADGDWQKALDLYDQILLKGHARPELRAHYRLCLRHLLFTRRQQDASFREQVLRQSPGDALRAYGEVLTKLGANYVDRGSCTASQLFHFGIDELDLALRDRAFCKEFAADAAAATVDAFRTRLHNEWGSAATVSVQEAETQALALALAGQKALGLKPAVTIWELVCGACCGLDEYSAYLTPAQLADELASMDSGKAEGSTVQAAQIIQGQPGIGYCHLTAFRKDSLRDLDAAIAELKPQGMKVLVLDLRGNPGGLFDSAVRIAERFLSDGVIVTTQTQLSSFSRTYRAHAGETTSIPLVVLIDGGTASAAEVLAGALKDNSRALLVGQPTFGKGSIQGILRLEAAPSGLRLTLARFFSPKGQPYQDKGVVPHVPVDPSPMSMSDPQLEIAVQEAARFLLMAP
jgi:hypothetical protein